MNQPIAILLCAVLGVAAPGVAQDRSRVQAEARVHFERGSRQAQAGDRDAALSEFERAYALSANAVVLFNVALLRAALGRPIEACDALDRLLGAPGELSAERLQFARELRAEQGRLVGQLAIETNVAGVVEIDGRAMATTPLPAPIRIIGGTHVVRVFAPGHVTSRQEVVIEGGATARIELHLSPTPAPSAHIELQSSIPDAQVRVDGTVVGVTPLGASFALEPGTRVLEVSRPGYHPERRTLSLAPGALARVRLDLERDLSDRSVAQGQLALSINEPSAHIAVDGQHVGVYSRPLLLPAGRHHVRIERAGFRPTERILSVPARGQIEAEFRLWPTPETRDAYVDGVQQQRFWGWAGTVAGAGFAIGGVALGLWSHASLPGLERQAAEAEAAIMRGSGGACDPDLAPAKGMARRNLIAGCRGQITQTQGAVEARKDLRTLGLASAVLGVALASLGAYLLGSSDELDRYDRAPRSAQRVAVSPGRALELGGPAFALEF